MVRTPSWPIEMKLPSGSCLRKAAGMARRPFSSTRTRWVPQNMTRAYGGVAPGGAPAGPPGFAAAGRSGLESGCWCVCHVVCCVFTCCVEWFTTSPHNSPRFATKRTPGRPGCQPWTTRCCGRSGWWRVDEHHMWSECADATTTYGVVRFQMISMGIEWGSVGKFGAAGPRSAPYRGRVEAPDRFRVGAPEPGSGHVGVALPSARRDHCRPAAAGLGQGAGQAVEAGRRHELEPGLDAGLGVVRGDPRHLLRVVGEQAVDGVQEVDVGELGREDTARGAEGGDRRRVGRPGQPAEHVLAADPLQLPGGGVRVLHCACRMPDGAPRAPSSQLTVRSMYASIAASTPAT